MWAKVLGHAKSLGHHILALEPNMEVFMKVLEPLIVVDMVNPKSNHVHKFDNDSFCISDFNGNLLFLLRFSYLVVVLNA
jgi:hypothetical protein